MKGGKNGGSGNDIKWNICSVIEDFNYMLCIWTQKLLQTVNDKDEVFHCWTGIISGNTHISPVIHYFHFAEI